MYCFIFVCGCQAKFYFLFFVKNSPLGTITNTTMNSYYNFLIYYLLHLYTLIFSFFLMLCRVALPTDRSSVFHDGERDTSTLVLDNTVKRLWRPTGVTDFGFNAMVSALSRNTCLHQQRLELFACGSHRTSSTLAAVMRTLLSSTVQCRLL